jgi:hypothetical protein
MNEINRPPFPVKKSHQTSKNNHEIKAGKVLMVLASTFSEGVMVLQSQP